jgi:hypothetical protein
MIRNSRPRHRPAVGIALAVVAACTLTAAAASAGPIGFQASAGWYTESDVAFLGAGARIGAGTITVIPNVEWLFVDNGSAYSLNLDGTMSVVPLGVASIYAGAGIGLYTVDPDRGDSNTETVFNLIGGAGFNALPLKPFAQLKWVVVDGNDPIVMSIGARF